MEFWEFLIQKDGDRSWLPLESPSVEILEGRYRVVARSSRLNAPVEIRLTHTMVEETPPKRRLQKRTSRTNPDGLIVIMPYTRLQPGHWELRCTGDLMADLMGQSWCYAVTLQVISQDSETHHDWDDWDGDGSESSEMAEPAAGTSPENAPENVSEVSENKLDLSAPAPVSIKAATPPSPSQPDEPIATPWLSLDRSNYSAQQGAVLTLVGQVGGIDRPPPGKLELWATLRDPQTATVAVQQRHPLVVDRLPTTAIVTLKLPTEANTRLFLGEIQLVTLADADPVILVAQSFTVTVNLDQLLEAIANDFVPSEAVRPPLQFLKPSDEIPLDLTLLDLVQAPPVPLQLHSAGQQLLPPQLQSSRAAVASDAPPKPLDLPFETPSHSATAISTPVEGGRSEQNDVPTPPDSPDLIQPSDLQPPIPSELSGDELDEAAVASIALEFLNPPAIAPNPPVLVEDEAFRSLNLAHRFWSRLNALASDGELSHWLQRVDPIESTAIQDAPLSLDSRLAANEVVVDDELVNDSAPITSARFAMARVREQADSVVDTPVLAEDCPIPAPRLDIPSGELIAGKSTAIVVTLPDVAARIYVKLWLHDRQTRTLLDGPRWLVIFLPAAPGEQQARAQLPIPHGCVEIQFEAIAVEIATQRESHKVTVNRSVIPPDFSVPVLRMEDLGI